MERVIVKKSSSPCLVVAPHGPDDNGTGIIAESIASQLKCGYVINQGWHRGDVVHHGKSIADCNSAPHLRDDLVKDEFVGPIKNCLKAINHCPYVPVLIIHGVGDASTKNYKDMHMVLGRGDHANGDRLTCDDQLLNQFASELEKQGLHTYLGTAGSKFAAADKKNLNQYIHHLTSRKLVTLQIEIIKAWRTDDFVCKAVGSMIATAANTLLYTSPTFMAPAITRLYT
jgi:hypothetical protein